MDYDFSGWATRNDLLCTDGRTIRRNAFKENDGAKVPLIWMHDHTNLDAVIGHAILENRDEGVYAYCKFNDTENGKLAKQIVKHGDVTSLSIWANQLKQIGKDVINGKIRELSLVLAGANSGAFIDAVMAHSDDGEDDGLIICYDERTFVIKHSDEEDDEDDEDEIDVDDLDDEEDDEDDSDEDESDEAESEEEGEDSMAHSDEAKKPDEKKAADGPTVQEVIDSMTEEQKKVMYAIVGAVAEGDADDDEMEHSDEDYEGGEDIMKYNVFDKEETMQQGGVISHADQEMILELAKKPGVGSLREALKIYQEENADTLAHGAFEDYSQLFPEYELLKKGEPETLERDQSWIAYVLNKIHKSPYSRIRTRYADARIAELRAKGYQNKGDEKTLMAQIKLAGRTTDPQTIYIKDTMHRDDVIDVTDFDVVAYQWRLMMNILKEELALAALIGDGREEGDPDKIHEEHIRSVWNDEELYTIHADVDIEGMRTTLQGTNTGANFSENYIYAEAMVQTILYAREKYKGSGTPDLFCTPHMVNVMLLSRDLNGRRIYASKAELTAALNVGAIHTVEQFENKFRTDKDGNKKQLLGLVVNMADYQFGSTKGGEISKFEDFDMDFNKYKYLLETRLSGSLTKLWSAIALELPVEDGAEG